MLLSSASCLMSNGGLSQWHWHWGPIAIHVDLGICLLELKLKQLGAWKANNIPEYASYITHSAIDTQPFSMRVRSRHCTLQSVESSLSTLQCSVLWYTCLVHAAQCTIQVYHSTFVLVWQAEYSIRLQLAQCAVWHHKHRIITCSTINLFWSQRVLNYAERTQQYVWNTDRVRVSTRAISVDTYPHGFDVRAGIRTVLPGVRTSTRSVFHLLHTLPYLPSAEREIHCVLPTHSTKVYRVGMYIQIWTAPLYYYYYYYIFHWDTPKATGLRQGGLRGRRKWKQ